MAETAGVHHLGLAVRDADETAAFFVGALGFEEVRRVPEYPAVFVSDGTVVLTLWQVDRSSRPRAFDRRRNTGLHHVALRIADPAALDAVYARASAYPGATEGFAPEPLRGGPTRHAMLYEPGGIRVELIAPG